MPGRMPDPCDRGALRAGREALRLLPDDRAEGEHPRRAAPAHRQPRVRLRRLPAGVPLEPLRAGVARARLPRAKRAGRRGADRALRLDGGGIPASHGGQRDPADRLRALAAKPRGGPGQCAEQRRRGRRVDRAGRAPFRAGARARRLGAGAPEGRRPGAIITAHPAPACLSRLPSFADLNLLPELLKAVAEQGYTEPTPIQAQAIPLVLEGRDVLAGAQPVTGKTAGFTLPLLHRLARHANASASPARHPVRAPILTPTRDLPAP